MCFITYDARLSSFTNECDNMYSLDPVTCFKIPRQIREKIHNTHCKLGRVIGQYFKKKKYELFSVKRNWF